MARVINYARYNIALGHGRFLYKIDGKKSEMIFAASDHMVPPGEYDEIREDVRPLFSVVIQSPKKARAIAAAFDKLADQMEEYCISG